MTTDDPFGLVDRRPAAGRCGGGAGRAPGARGGVHTPGVGPADWRRQPRHQVWFFGDPDHFEDEVLVSYPRPAPGAADAEWLLELRMVSGFDDGVRVEADNLIRSEVYEGNANQCE